MMAEVSEDNSSCEYDEFLLLMSKQLNSNEQDEDLIECFKSFDRDGKGFINYSDLKANLKKDREEISDEDCKLIFDNTDVDKDGKISFKDFMLMMMSK